MGTNMFATYTTCVLLCQSETRNDTCSVPRVALRLAEDGVLSRHTLTGNQNIQAWFTTQSEAV